MILFEPFPYDHAAALVGRTPWEVSRSPDLLYRAFATAIERYRLRHVVPGIDIYNLEAESLGCTVQNPGGNASPLISGPVCASHAEIQRLRADIERSRFTWLLETAARLRHAYPDCSIRIPMAGPFTLAGHLLGLNDLLCDCLLQPAETRASLEHLAGILLEFAGLAAQQEFEITLFESSASPPMLSPALFASLLKPVLHTLLDQVEVRCGARPAFIMGGDTLPVLEHILDLRPSYIICPIETRQLEFVSRLVETDQDVHVRVNLKPSVFMHSTSEALLQEASRAASLALRCRRASIGTILPFETQPHNVDAVTAFLASGN